MAFTRSYLKQVAKESDIELPKELVEALINAHIEARDAHATAESEKAVIDYKTKNPTKVTKSQDTEEYKALEKQFNDFKSEVDGKETAKKKMDLLRDALKVAGANEKFIGRMLKTTDLSTVIIKDGKLEKPEETVASFKTEWGDVFGEFKQQPTNTGNPQTTPQTTQIPTSLKGALAEKFNK